VAGLLSFQPDERIAQVLTLSAYDDAQYLVLATRQGLVKKTVLSAYDSPRQAGVIAISFRQPDDELIGAELADAGDDVLLISRKGQAIRFVADDEQLRPMGRATSGVTGMKFRPGDALLSLSVIKTVATDPALAGGEPGRTPDSAWPPVAGVTDDWPDEDASSDDESPGALSAGQSGLFVFTVTDGGYAKRTAIEDYRRQGRGGLGIKAMKLVEDRGSLVGGLIVTATDQIIAIKTSGQIIRSSAAEVPVQGRDTMGVKFVGLRGDDLVAQIALYPEDEAARELVLDAGEDEGVEGRQAEAEPSGTTPVTPDEPSTNLGIG
jgi:DNA gyrase subunit A